MRESVALDTRRGAHSRHEGEYAVAEAARAAAAAEAAALWRPSGIVPGDPAATYAGPHATPV